MVVVKAEGKVMVVKAEGKVMVVKVKGKISVVVKAEGKIMMVVKAEGKGYGGGEGGWERLSLVVELFFLHHRSKSFPSLRGNVRRTKGSYLQSNEKILSA